MISFDGGEAANEVVLRSEQGQGTDEEIRVPRSLALLSVLESSYSMPTEFRHHKLLLQGTE